MALTNGVVWIAPFAIVACLEELRCS